MTGMVRPSVSTLSPTLRGHGEAGPDCVACGGSKSGSGSKQSSIPPLGKALVHGRGEEVDECFGKVAAEVLDSTTEFEFVDFVTGSCAAMS